MCSKLGNRLKFGNLTVSTKNQQRDQTGPPGLKRVKVKFDRAKSNKFVLAKCKVHAQKLYNFS